MNVVVFSLASVACFFVFIYFLYWGRQRQENRSLRRRYRERGQQSRPEQPIDPNFQFDRPPTHREENADPSEPN